MLAQSYPGNIVVIALNFRLGPTKNRMYMRSMTRHGLKRLTPEYARWRDVAGWEIRMAMAGHPQVSCRFDVHIEVPQSRADVQNYVDPILDLLERCGVVSNDANAHKVSIEPVTGRIDCLVILTELPDLAGIRPPSKTIRKLSASAAVRKRRPTTAQIARFERARRLI